MAAALNIDHFETSAKQVGEVIKSLCHGID